MKSLFHITQEYSLISDELIESGGELTGGLETALLINQEDLQTKAVQLAMVFKDLEYQEEYCRAEISRIAAIQKRVSGAQDRLKDTISAAMNLYGITEIKGDNIKLSFRASEALNVIDLSAIPAFLKDEKVIETVDKKELAKMIKAGTNIPGVELEKRLNLQIK